MQNSHTFSHLLDVGAVAREGVFVWRAERVAAIEAAGGRRVVCHSIAFAVRSGREPRVLDDDAPLFTDAAAETATAIGADPGDLAERLAALMAAVEPQEATIHGSFHDDQVLVGAEIVLLDLDSAAIGHPLLDVGHFASYLTAAGEDAARARFLEACDPGPEALLFEAAALLRWSSLPFRDLEPGWREAVGRRVDLARARPRDYERRSASSVITAS